MKKSFRINSFQDLLENTKPAAINPKIPIKDLSLLKSEDVSYKMYPKTAARITRHKMILDNLKSQSYRIEVLYEFIFTYKVLNIILMRLPIGFSMFSLMLLPKYGLITVK